MLNHNKAKSTADKEKEIQEREISKMISEGGLGADRYYSIESSHTLSENDTKK